MKKWRGFLNRTSLTKKILAGLVLAAAVLIWFSQRKDVPRRAEPAGLMNVLPRDAIPSIDKPKFESVETANTWLRDGDIVFALNYKSEVRAYAQRILNWHEIVNDEVLGDPITITFCPLCGSALAFNRQLNGEVLEFGVSGKLQNNDLVMYDRQTETLWQQITGEAIVGEHFGKRLKQISLDGLHWADFRQKYPKGKVLSRDTGFSRDYDVYPYGDYETNPALLFPIEGGVDQTIHPKAVVWGIEVGANFKAYEETKLASAGALKNKVGGVPIEIAFKDGETRVKNLQTGEEITATRLFWFAWKAFHPETELY